MRKCNLCDSTAAIMTKIVDFRNFAGVESQKGHYYYKATAMEDGTLLILAECEGDAIKIVGTDGQDMGIGFTLRPGTTHQEARALANSMNRWIADIRLFNMGG